MNSSRWIRFRFAWLDFKANFWHNVGLVIGKVLGALLIAVCWVLVIGVMIAIAAIIIFFALWLGQKVLG